MRRRSRDAFVDMRTFGAANDEFRLLLCLCYQQPDGIIRAFSMVRKRVRPVQFRAGAKKAGPGRPPVHSETWSKVSVVLFDRQISHLDRLTANIRDASGKMMNRAEIIRALIDGLIDSGMDVTVAASEADLRARVARRLGTPYR